MSDHLSRRDLLIAASAAGLGSTVTPAPARASRDEPRRGRQRLSLEQLRRWEAMRYGMFIHFGMSTFDGNEFSEGKAPPSLYNPDKLDVDQWVSVARDAGMKYAVLTAKHVAGHCLWPSRHTDYTVANSGNKTNICEAFVKACEKRGVMPGFYYCSWDNHNLFGSLRPGDPNAAPGWDWRRYNFRDPANPAAPTDPTTGKVPPFTSSIYQGFQTAQIRELLTQFGPIGEVWIDIPGLLGMGYRTFLYHEIARLQPQTVVMMNSGISTGEDYDVDYAWPSDLIAIEKQMPPETGHKKWRTVEGEEYYLPGELCETVCEHWFYTEGDKPRADADLLKMFNTSKDRGVNLLLDVGPDRHGVIPDNSVQTLMRLKKNAGA